MNLHFRPNPFLVVVSLALILTAIGLVILWMLIPIDWLPDLDGPPWHPGYNLIRYASFMWFQVTLVIGLIAGLNHLNFKPLSIFLAVSLAFLLILFLSIIQAEIWTVVAGLDPVPVLLLLTSFLEIIMLGAGWKLLSLVREFNKTRTTSTLVGEERIVE